MRTIFLITALTLGLAAQASAASNQNAASMPAPAQASGFGTYFAVRDTVGNCAVVDTLPSRHSGLRILGDKSGYPSEADAQKTLGTHCRGVVDRS